MDKYECVVCGYIYDPEKGDPDNGVAPGTPFDKIPDDWVCPECGAPKDQFEKLKAESGDPAAAAARPYSLNFQHAWGVCTH